VTCLGASVPTLAKAQVSVNHACPVENAQVSVSFNGMDTDVAVVRSKLNAKIAEIKSLAQEQQFTKLVLQSYNYNISTNYNAGSGGETHLQYNGNITFSILPADKAVDFMQLLAKKGYQASVSVNSYNTGNCGSS
jgi:hypothetical protein